MGGGVVAYVEAMRRSTRVLHPLAFAVGGAFLAWTGSLLIPDRYTSSAVVRVDVEPFPETDVINHAYQAAVNRKVLGSIIQRLNLYPGERERLPLEDVIETVKKEEFRLEIQRDHEVRLAFAYHDPGGAQAAANALMNEMILASDEHYRSNPGWGRLAIKNAASPGEASPTLAFWRPRRYVAQGIMVVKRNAFPVEREAAEKTTENLAQTALSEERLASSIASHDLYPLQREHGLLKELVDEMRRQLQIERHANVLTIKFTYPDARLAQITVSGLITELIDERARLPECVQTPEVESKSGGPSSLPGPDRYPSALLGVEPELLEQDVKGSMGSPIAESLEIGKPIAPTPRREGLSADGTCRDPRAPEWQGAIDILDPASLPAEPDGPSRPILAIFGFFLGLGLWTALKD